MLLEPGANRIPPLGGHSSSDWYDGGPVCNIEWNEPSIMLIKTNHTITFLTPHVVIIDFGMKIEIDQN